MGGRLAQGLGGLGPGTARLPGFLGRHIHFGMAPFVARFGAEFRLASLLKPAGLDLRNPPFRRKRDTQRGPQRIPDPLLKSSSTQVGFQALLGDRCFKRFVDTKLLRGPPVENFCRLPILSAFMDTRRPKRSSDPRSRGKTWRPPSDPPPPARIPFFFTQHPCGRRGLGRASRRQHERSGQ